MFACVSACAAMGYPMCLSGYLDTVPRIDYCSYLGVSTCTHELGCLQVRVSRNLEKKLAEAPQAPKFFEICHTPLSLKYNERAVG